MTIINTKTGGMRNKFTLALFTLGMAVCTISSTIAQTNDLGFNYQAVARNKDGVAIANKQILVEISIRKGSSTGITVWQETHQVTTNNYGLFSVIMGKGNTTGVGSLNSFSEIDWTSKDYYTGVRADFGNGLLPMGNVQLQTMPYALVADTALAAPRFPMSELTDVNTSNLQTNDILKWDGTKWLPINFDTNLAAISTKAKADSIAIMNQINTNLANETSRATTAEGVLTNGLAAEIARATSAETTLTNNLAQEVIDRTNGDAANATAISNEATTRAANDATITAKAVSDSTFLKGEINSTNTNLATEIARATAAETTLTNNLAQEVIDRTNGDAANATAISNEATTRATNDATITAKAVSDSTFLKGEINTINTNLATEIARATSAETTLTNNLDQEVADRTLGDLANSTAISNEATTRAMDDATITAKAVSDSTALRALINTNATDLADEISMRTSEDATNASAIATETLRATTAETTLTNNLAQEVIDRTNGDAANATAISNEATTRATNDATITAKAVSDSTALRGLINTNASDLATETARATAAETALTNDLATEVNNRTTADALKANIASPALTGTPTAPTATAGTNTTQIATTAFVTNAVNSVSNLQVPAGGTGLTTITNGNILFGNGTNPIGNSSNLFWDNTNSRFGLLTSSPSTTFQIGNDNTAENLKWGVSNDENTFKLGYRQTGWKLKAGNNSGVITDLYFSRNNGTTDQNLMSLGESSGVQIYSTLNVQNTLTAPQGNLTNLDVNSGKIYYNSTDNKVGFFTQYPTSQFQVYGDGNFEYPLKYDGDNSSGTLKFGFRSKEFRISTTSNSGVLNRLSFKYYDGSTESESMYLDNAGNVGINTLTVGTVIKSGGTSSQFLKADGSVDANTYLQAADVSSTYLPLTGGTLTGTLSMDNLDQNKSIVLFNDELSDHQFYGFGYNSANNGTLRYQVKNSDANHIFYAGSGLSASQELFRIAGTGEITAQGDFTTQGSITANNGDLVAGGNAGTFHYYNSSGHLIVGGEITGTSFVRTGGTSSQFLKADGSVDANTYLQAADVSSTYLPLSGGTLSGKLTLNDSLVIGNDKIYIDGNDGSLYFTEGSIKIGGHHPNFYVSNDGDMTVRKSLSVTNMIDIDTQSKIYVYDTISSQSLIEAEKFVMTGGTSSQFIKADGSVDANTYLQAADVSSTYLPLTGGTLSGSLSGTTAIFTNDITINGVNIGNGTGNNDYNLAFGTNLGTGTGQRNTALGLNAMNSYSGTGFDNNTSVGYSNLSSLTTGDANTSVGAEAMLALTTGTNNTGIGNQSLVNTIGSGNSALGANAGSVNTSGSNNTYLGYTANAGSATLSNATALGYGATVDASNTIQLGNSSITSVSTYGSLTTGAVTYPNTDGSSGQILTTNGSGTLSWSDAALSYSVITTDSDQNMAISTSSFSNAENGEATENTAFGYLTLNSITNGAYNTAFGSSALSSSTSSSGNTAIGRAALGVTTTGGYNTALGQNALLVNTEGLGNIAIGVNSLDGNTSGGNNIGIGGTSLHNNVTGSYNMGIGHNADVSTDGLSNAIAIGYNASVSASNTIQLGNSDITLVKTEGSYQVASDEAFYFGDSTTNGSWRIIRSGDNLVFERREAGSWVTKTSMQP